MKIHHYSRDTGEFLSTTDAKPSPKEPGVFLVPAHATKIAPPYPGVGKVAVFVAGAWQVKDDLRGTTVYRTSDGAAITIDTIGTLPATIGATTTARPSADHAWDGNAWVLDPALVIANITVATAAAIDNLLGTVAKEREYDNAISFRSYAGWGDEITNPFRTEAEAFALWCAACWAKVGEIRTAVQSGQRELPTVEQVLSELPASPF